MKQNHEPDPFDPFDPENLRIDQSYLSQPAAKKLLTTVPVRKPHKQDFIRVHPAEDYRLNAALVELHDERETYLVLPRFISELGEGEYFVATLYLCVNRPKRPMKTWIRVVANMNLGAYEAHEAVQNFGEPEWPEFSFNQILRIAFKGRVIEGPDHLVIKKLRGMA